MVSDPLLEELCHATSLQSVTRVTADVLRYFRPRGCVIVASEVPAAIVVLATSLYVAMISETPSQRNANAVLRKQFNHPIRYPHYVSVLRRCLTFVQLEDEKS